MATNIIQTGGKVIKSGQGNSFKQNYLFGGGVLDLLSYRVTLAQALSEYTIFNMVNSRSPVPTTSNSTLLGRHWAWRTFDEGGVELDYINGWNGGRASSFGRVNSAGTLQTSTTSANLADTLSIAPAVTVAQHVRIDAQLVRGAFFDSLTARRVFTLNCLQDVKRMKTYEKFNTGTSVNNPVWGTRLCIFNRTIDDRELNYLYNRGNSNDVLTRLGLVCEINFRAAQIVSIPGLGDRVGFVDDSGNSNHAYITAGLPAGTLQEQVDFVNQNRRTAWIF